MNEDVQNARELENFVAEVFKGTSLAPYSWQYLSAILLCKEMTVIQIPTGLGKSHVMCVAAVHLLK